MWISLVIIIRTSWKLAHSCKIICSFQIFQQDLSTRSSCWLNDAMSAAKVPPGINTVFVVEPRFSCLYIFCSLKMSPNMANLQSSEKYLQSMKFIAQGSLLQSRSKLFVAIVQGRRVSCVLGHCLEVVSLFKEREQHRKSCTQLLEWIIYK